MAELEVINADAERFLDIIEILVLKIHMVIIADMDDDTPINSYTIFDRVERLPLCDAWT